MIFKTIFLCFTIYFSNYFSHGICHLIETHNIIFSLFMGLLMLLSLLYMINEKIIKYKHLKNIYFIPFCILFSSLINISFSSITEQDFLLISKGHLDFQNILLCFARKTENGMNIFSYLLAHSIFFLYFPEIIKHSKKIMNFLTLKMNKYKMKECSQENTWFFLMGTIMLLMLSLSSYSENFYYPDDFGIATPPLISGSINELLGIIINILSFTFLIYILKNINVIMKKTN